MSENERELINIVRGSCNPELVAQYVINLCVTYLRTYDPSRESYAAAPRESA